MASKLPTYDLYVLFTLLYRGCFHLIQYYTQNVTRIFLISVISVIENLTQING